LASFTSLISFNCRKLLKEMVVSMLRARNGQPADEDEGPAGDEDQRADPKEEVKDNDHILEVRQREEGLTQRMQTRQSQKTGIDLR
jgi:hypothetical protein